LASPISSGGQILALELEGIDHYTALIESVAFVSWRRLERGDPAVLALAFSE